MAGRTNKSTKVCVWRRSGLAAHIRCALLQGLVRGQSRCSEAFEQWPLLLECRPMKLIRWMAMYHLNGNLQAKDHLDQACVGACRLSKRDR